MVKGFKILQIIRPVNLAVIFLTQLLLFYFIIEPRFINNGVVPLLNLSMFIQLSLCTILLAAGSFVINDIFDIEIDKINKSSKLIVSKLISVKQAYGLYICTIIIGCILAINVAFQLDKTNLLWIYPLAIAGLYLYAARLKKSFLLGNILVAIFSAFVAGILIIAEWDNIMKLVLIHPDEAAALLQLFFFYITFAFITTLIREIIKDIEDIDGDILSNAQTAPIKIGIHLTKILIYVLQAILISTIIYWLANSTENLVLWKHLFMFCLVIIPLIYLTFKIYKAKVSKDYHRISTELKLIMLAGIIFIFIV